METNNLQRTAQTESIVITNDSKEAPISTAQSSDQNLSAVTASASSLPGLAPETNVSCTQIDRVVAPSDQHEALMRHARDTWDTATAQSASPEIADSNNGRTGDDGAGKHPLFDVFAEDNDGLVNDGQSPAKRRRRASSAASSVCSEEVWTPLVVVSPHDAGLYTDLNPEEMLDDHEWQAQRIVGERQTPSGLQYEVSVEKTLWLPRAALDVKLVRMFRAQQRAATRVRTRWSSRLRTAGGLVRQ